MISTELTLKIYPPKEKTSHFTNAGMEEKELPAGEKVFAEEKKNLRCRGRTEGFKF